MKKPIGIKRELQYEILVFPALVAYIIFFLIPSVETFRYSFTDWNGYSKTYSYIGLQNYVNIFNDISLISAIKNTLIFAIAYTILQNIVGMFLAVGLDSKLKSRNFLRMIFFMPSVFSSLIIGFIWSYILSSSEAGLFNYILKSVGMEFLKSSWLGDPKLAMNSIILVAVWQSAGWAMVIYLANLQSVPIEILESAEIDGANGWKKFYYITIRMMAPSITINSLVSMISGLKVFDYVVALTGGGPGYATETITTSIIRIAFKSGDFAYGSALAIIMFIVIFIIAIIQLNFLHKGEESVYNA